jgi:hypothetical protein
VDASEIALILFVVVVLAVSALALRYADRQSRHMVAPISVIEVEDLDRLRGEQPQRDVDVPRGKVRFRNGFLQDTLVITENGILADFGTPKLHNFGRFRMVKGEQVVVYVEKMFYPFEEISGIYPIKVAVSLYDDSKIFPGFQIETVDYRTAVVLFRYSEDKFSRDAIKALGPSARTLVNLDEVVAGSDKVVGGTDGEGTTIFRGRLHRHKYLRDNYRMEDLSRLGNQ